MQEIFRMVLPPHRGGGLGRGSILRALLGALATFVRSLKLGGKILSALRGSVGGLKTAGYELQKQFILNFLSRTVVIMFRMEFLPYGRMRALKRD